LKAKEAEMKKKKKTTDDEKKDTQAEEENREADLNEDITLAVGFFFFLGSET
jgi:hypothetical protein